VRATIVMSALRSDGAATSDVDRVDDEVLTELFAEHGRPLLSFALRLTGGDRGRAEDIVQETLLRAWRHPDALDDARGPIRPWLFTVARHLAVDGHRKRRARPVEVPADVAVGVPGGDEIERVLEGWLVSDALATLSPDHRAVLVETFYHDHSVAAAAAVLGVPAGTVKSRTYYALRALRVALDERGVTA
jgi:RNA polymerase sigma-70 factor (ECF subfamily)